MISKIKGIHHITAIGSSPQTLVDFYTHILGLRLVKKSVNQDDTSTYHLFFGDKTGEPGMDITFFTFKPVFPGLRGTGLVTTISLAVPKESLQFWKDRFKKHEVKYDENTTTEYEQERNAGIERLTFYDPDNQRLELVGIENMKEDSTQVWTTKEVTAKEAIRSFYSARLTVINNALVEPILTQVFGYEVVDKGRHTTLYHLTDINRAAYLEVEESPQMEQGINAAGTVHHIAFAVETEEEQLKVREKIQNLGLYPTQVIDRYYFKSVYFRTPAGILFEIATNGPGFTVDEAETSLGEKLALPPFLEDQRKEIETELEPITYPRN